ncbi:thioredoxin domain-containing protein [Herbiconiux sp. P18]|uniref:thioredoxin domain-containing protein n=1 Tax=Herbiconiux liangxiaofengii TaxID=3342795 RepID=UPI0035BA38CA
MTNRLAGAISPYLRSHAENPVDWYPWGEEAFAAARERDVPVLVSIGYSTCHWCHVMARESFSDPALAGYLNERFVAIKVDREEHPEVDSAYLAAAGAFTQNLGWPLNVFVTPAGQAFHAGTYSPPTPVDGHPAFSQVLAAVDDAWTNRRAEVERSAAGLAEMLAEGQQRLRSRGAVSIPDAEGPEALGLEPEQLASIVSELAQYEDATHGGFGGAPKFPVAPVLRFLLEAAAIPGGDAVSRDAGALAVRTLRAMAASPLRDPVEGGFFRYATRRDWSEPHYERMLYDNALLLDAYTAAWTLDPTSAWARDAALGVGRFLTDVMQLPSGGFASAQDSESTVDGRRVEGGYYALDAAERSSQTPPALDEKVLSGWNGLAIGSLARVGFVFDRPDLILAAQHVADYLLAAHLSAAAPPTSGPEAPHPSPSSAPVPDAPRLARSQLLRASIDGRASSAVATLEDYGMLADGLLRLAAVTGSARYAVAGRMLVDAVLSDPATEGAAFEVPGGGDPVLSAQGLASELDPSEGAYPSGNSAAASAAMLLHALTAEPRYRAAALRALAPLAADAGAQPIAFGATLELLTRLARPSEQLVLIEPDPEPELALDPGHGPAPDAPPAAEPSREPEREVPTASPLRDRVRVWTGAVVARASEAEAEMLARAGFELFADRTTRGGHPTAYLCRDFVCRLPITAPADLHRD